MQRLLPMEQFLSQLPRAVALPQRSTARPASEAQKRVDAGARPQQAQAPALSRPQAALRQVEEATAPVFVPPPVIEPAVAPQEIQPAPALIELASGPGSLEEVVEAVTPPFVSSVASAEPEPLTSVRPDPEATEPASSPELTQPADTQIAIQMQTAAVEALFAAKSHNSAAEQLEECTWTISDGEVKIQTSLSKQLMSTIFRPEVEAIIKGALREKGLGGVRLVFVAGDPQSKPKAPKKPRTGSAQAKALEHPTVQAAQRLFNAEVTTVFDLRRD